VQLPFFAIFAAFDYGIFPLISLAILHFLPSTALCPGLALICHFLPQKTKTVSNAVSDLPV
jgi:hypothetical protein